MLWVFFGFWMLLNWFLLCFKDDDLHEILSNDDEIESLILEVVDKVLEYQSKFAEKFNELKDLLTRYCFKLFEFE